MNLFSRDKSKVIDVSGLPPIEDQVNYNSVLDYLTGLSKADYAKMIKSADIYREANAKVAKVVGVKDEPTATLITPQLTDEEIDAGLDKALNTPPDFEEDDLPVEPSKPTKPQASRVKVEVK